MFLCKYVLIVAEPIVLMIMYLHQHKHTKFQFTQLTIGLPEDEHMMFETFRRHEELN
jgi:hypothetical protein